MNKNTALLAAGIIFAIVSLVHLLRVYTKFDLIIAGVSIPIWANVVGFIISFLLAIWMFKARR